jgi:hypothetical protein
MKARGARLRLRTLPILPQESAISTALEVYTVSNAKPNRGLRLWVQSFGDCWYRNLEGSGTMAKKCGPFSVVSSRYLDRGRVGPWGGKIDVDSRFEIPAAALVKKNDSKKEHL